MPSLSDQLFYLFYSVEHSDKSMGVLMGIGRAATEEAEDILPFVAEDLSPVVSSEGIHSSASSLSPMSIPMSPVRPSHRKIRFVIPHWIQQSVPR